MTKSSLVEEIIKGIHEFKVIPFFGAGMSKPLGLKTWKEIIDELNLELGSKSASFLDIAQEYEDRFTRQNLLEKLKINYETEIDPSKLDLQYLILSMDPPLVYTTNYDNAIEFAAKELNRNYYKVASLKDIVDAPHNSRMIVKFHGDFSAPENIVFTRSDYDNRLQIQHELDVMFRAHLLGKSILFLGYSFTDENIDFIFNKHKDLYGTKYLPKSYIITINKDAKREAELLEKNVITLHLDSLDELPSLITQINQKVFHLDIDRQFKSIFNCIPLTTLLKFELTNLRTYISSPDHTNAEKSEKLSLSIEGRLIPQSLVQEFLSFIDEILTSDNQELREALVRSYNHIHLTKESDIFFMSFSFLCLTQDEKFIRTMENAFEFLDILSLIEARLRPEKTVLLILIYLDQADKHNLITHELQAKRFLEMLLACNYKNIQFKSGKYPAEERDKIVSDLILKYPKLKSELGRKPLVPRTTISQLEDIMIESFPKSIRDKF